MKNTILSSFMIIGIFCFGLIPEKAEADCEDCLVKCQTESRPACGNCVRENKCKWVGVGNPMCLKCIPTCFSHLDSWTGGLAPPRDCGNCLADHCHKGRRK